VAVKLVHRNLTQDTEVVARFHREAHAAAAIGSDHIVDILDVGLTAEGTPYQVMEYLEGNDLRALLGREGALEPARAIEYILQTCHALSAAHARGIVHRDIKPANLFLTRWDDGTEWIKVLDFGIAKFRDSMASENPDLTLTGRTVGTPYYMSPEQAQGERDVDERTDIYATAVALYELLTGQKPFQATAVNRLIVLISTTAPPPLRHHRPELTPQLEEVVLHAMARDRADRYQTIGEFAEALAAAAQGEQPSRSPQPVAAPWITDGPREAIGARRDGWGTLSLATVAVVAIAAVFTPSLQSGYSSPPTEERTAAAGADQGTVTRTTMEARREPEHRIPESQDHGQRQNEPPRQVEHQALPPAGPDDADQGRTAEQDGAAGPHGPPPVIADAPLREKGRPLRKRRRLVSPRTPPQAPSLGAAARKEEGDAGPDQKQPEALPSLLRQNPYSKP
jgi:hypothetical protein